MPRHIGLLFGKRLDTILLSHRIRTYPDSPVHALSDSLRIYPDIFESATFSFRIRLPSKRTRRIRQQIRIFLNPLTRVENNKSATNPITCGRENPDIFESDDVAKSCPVSYRTINQYGGTTCRPRANRANFPPLSRALWRMV